MTASFSAVSEKIKQLTEELGEIEKERDKVRERYIEALKDKNVLEKLKEKKMAEHRKREMGKEEKSP